MLFTGNSRILISGQLIESDKNLWRIYDGRHGVVKGFSDEEPYEAMQHNLNKVFCGDPLSKFRFILRRRLQHFQSLNTQRFPEGFCARFLHQRLVLYRHWSCHDSLVN